jgi:hypothetical protein
MSRDAPLPAGGTYDKIFQLEDQVKGLMETVNQLHKAYHLDKLNIPKPDQYVRAGGYTMGDMYDRMPRTKPMQTAAPASDGTKTSSEAEIKPRIATSEIPKLAPYKYSPLSAESSEIRLIALETSTSLTDPIVCRLFKVSLESAPKYVHPGNPLPIGLYTPLSYCWGTTSGTKHIVVDGGSFLVTPSLYTALLHFRKANQNPPDTFKKRGSNSETYWWIDAICINQNDLDERNSQVGLMTRLYKQAQMVHVWLGEESEDSARAMQVIRELAYLPKSSEERDTWNYIPKPGQTHRPDGPGRPMVKLPTEPAPISAEEQLKNYEALINLFQRPWFSRVWIRQEVALPGSVKFHCGTETCDWTEMMRTADILAYLVDEYHLPALQQGGIRRDGSFASCFQRATELDTIRRETNKGTRYIKLESLVLRSRDCQATDSRDKIYAMLPLTNPDETDIAADYRKDHCEVYKAVALSLVNTDIDYLSGCQNPSRSKGLPSWVPNLEAPWDSLPTMGIGHQTDLENWPSTDVGLPQFTYSPEQSRLDVQGVIFDKIGTINHDSYLTADASNADVHAVVAQWKEFYVSQRQKLFTSWEEEGGKNYWDKREQCARMFDSFEVQREWGFSVLQNTLGDTRRYVGGGKEDDTRFNRWGDSTVDHDPTLKKVRRLLPSESTPFSNLFNKDNYFADLRPLVVGRRCVTTSKGAIALAPIAAEAGDEVCFFDGSGCPFVIRKAGDGTWVIVGQACKFLFGCFVNGVLQTLTKIEQTTLGALCSIMQNPSYPKQSFA